MFIIIVGDYYVIPSIYTNKKRDCNLAVPLIEALALPLLPNKQH